MMPSQPRPWKAKRDPISMRTEIFDAEGRYVDVFAPKNVRLICAAVNAMDGGDDADGTPASPTEAWYEGLMAALLDLDRALALAHETLTAVHRAFEKSMDPASPSEGGR